MERKIISIFIALVLVLSFSLVTAVPVAAQSNYPQFLDVVPFDVTTGEWSTTVEATTPQSGDYSYHVVLPADSSGVGLDIIHKYIYGPTGVGTMTLPDINSMTFWEYVKVAGGTMQMGAGITLYMDMNADGDFDWVNDAQIILESPYPDDPLVLDNIGQWALRDIDDFAGFQKGGGSLNADYTGVDGVALHCTLAEWQASDYAEYVVLWVGIVAGWGDYGDYDGYFDDFIINGDTYVLEPGVINTDTSEGFSTIQAAIDDEDTVGGHTISVAAGTYNPASPLVVDKSLILTGDTTTPTNVVVNAPTTGIDKDAFQVIVDDVTIQGFNIKGAVSGTPSGWNGYQNAGIMVGNDGGAWGGQLMDRTDGPIDGLSGININHNKIEDCSLGVYLYEVTSATVNDNEILRSTIENQGSAGTGIIWFAESEVSGVDGIEMKRNTITDSDRIGMCFVSWAVRNDIANTDIADNIITGTKYEGSGHDQDDDAALAFMWVDGSNFSVTGNTLADSLSYGVVVGTSSLEDWPGMDTSWCTGITFEYNNIQNNARGGMINRYITGGDVDAANNWWGSATGPEHVTNPGGLGDAVSDNVDFTPWLLSEGGEPVVTYTDYISVPDGWSLISPDRAWADWEAMGSDLVLTYDTSLLVPAFVEPQSLSLSPLSAIYIKTTGGGLLGMNYPDYDLGMYATSLEAGWNLIGIPETNAEPGAILSPLRYGVNNETALATLASQGNYNPSAETFYEDAFTWANIEGLTLSASDGYWAYMNVAKEFGVVVVPASP